MKYITVNDYLKTEYGYKLYKIAIDAGLSCPNRDGTISFGGCIFCSEGGSGDFAGSHLKSINEQIQEGKSRISRKFKIDDNDTHPRYIAYFQAFTNTYGPINYLRKIYMNAASNDDIAIISIGTRPDCLSEEVLELLDEINNIKPVWIELGLQSIHENTAQMINRGYKLEIFDKAVTNLKNLNIKVIVHVILGLPGEDASDMFDTVQYVVDSGAWGIKLQLLHVLKNTRLADMYENKEFEAMGFDDYLKIITGCVEIIGEKLIIHRLTGDGPKKLLLAPMWSGDKKRVLNGIHKCLD